MTTPSASSSSPNLPGLVLVTGMSGAGRSSAATALEEMGWYVADNLPPELIVRMVELSFSDESPIERLAIVADMRSRDFLGSLTDVLDTLSSNGKRPTVVFLEADDAELTRRYVAGRRTHPLQGDGTLAEGIAAERTALRKLKNRSDIVLDTTRSTVADLRYKLENFFAESDRTRININLRSFGFKNGAPHDVDVMLDARFLSNPYWVPELRPYRGTDAPVADYVLQQQEAQDFIASAVTMLQTMISGYEKVGKRFVSVAIGCTGGHHRSVAVVEEIGKRIAGDGVSVRISHRDIDHP